MGQMGVTVGGEDEIVLLQKTQRSMPQSTGRQRKLKPISVMGGPTRRNEKIKGAT